MGDWYPTWLDSSEMKGYKADCAKATMSQASKWGWDDSESSDEDEGGQGEEFLQEGAEAAAGETGKPVRMYNKII